MKNRAFQRDLRGNSLDDEYIKAILRDVFKGRATQLGSKMYKIRAAKEGQGKSGGFRNIFFWKQNELIIFCALFGKNEQDNLTADEKKALKILSNEYDRLTNDEIKTAIRSSQFMEIDYSE